MGMEEKKYKLKPGYVLRELGGEYLVIPVDLEGEPDTRVAMLNPVARLIWEQLEEEKTVTELTEAVTAEFEVGDGEARADVEEFLGTLEAQHFLIG
ncbi:MAG: PqqD family protein [Clostridia bacterium]|nr:PqqD family protein [Clostridia bacterium]